jgi:pyridoxal phosphate enzyme (YggS family)
VSIATSLVAVRARIDAACRACGRSPDDVALLAVSKRMPERAIREAYAAGQRDFGENYVQELVQKAEALADLPDLRLHLIGHLQTNKAKSVARVAHAVQSVDSMRVAEALAKATPDGRVLHVHVQVDVADEATKSGADLADVEAIVAAIRREPRLVFDGFMTIPPADDVVRTREAFRTLRALARTHGVTSLSMGMSGDLEMAIEEGATCVRVGTAIFGTRA